MYEEVSRRLKQTPRTWLVTGAAGFIGSHLLERLLNLDQRVVGLDNFSTGKHGNLTQVKEAVSQSQWKNFRFIEADIRSRPACHRACRSVELVLHQAAIGSVPLSIADPVAANETNVTGFLNMLVAARDASVSRFVYAGSSAAYGDTQAVPNVEPDIGRPLSPYALTKHVNELYAGIFARCYGLESIGLRYFNVFGPRQDPKGAYVAVIPLWIAAMIRDEPIFINGDGETVRDFCPIDNVVQANLLAAMVDDASAVDQVYNIALGERITLNELFETIRSLLEPCYPSLRNLHPVYGDFRAGDIRISQADIGKAVRMLGYRPLRPLVEELQDTLDWYVAQAGPRASVRDALPRTRAAVDGVIVPSVVGLS